MKAYQTTLLTITFALVSITSSQAQPLLTNGLVAYYPFDGNANDGIGTHHGTVVGAVLTQDRFGSGNAAYTFNGTSSRIDFSAPPLTQNSNWTLSAWVKPASIAQEGMAIELGFDNGTSGDGFGLGLHSSVWTGIFSSIDYLSSGQSPTNTNSWYHLVMLRDTNITKFFINGVQASPTYTLIPKIPTDFTIGSQNGYRFFKGAIDDVRIYNRPLSQGEVTLLYQENPVCFPHAAKATAIITNGFLVGTTIIDSGCGYTNVPQVTVIGGGGSGATATATLSNDRVVAINITDAGCCYSNAPTILIESPPFAPSLSIAVSRVNVTVHVMIGKNYVIESSPDLINWTATGQQFTADSENITTEFVVSQTARYFRVRQVL